MQQGCVLLNPGTGVLLWLHLGATRTRGLVYGPHLFCSVTRDTQPRLLVPRK